MEEFITKLKSLKNGHKIGQMCVYIEDRTKTYIQNYKNENKQIDVKTLRELREQWAFDFKVENGLDLK